MMTSVYAAEDAHGMANIATGHVVVVPLAACNSSRCELC